MQHLELPSIDGIRLGAAWHAANGHGSRGVVVQAYGINADMTEGGMYVRLADQLAKADFNVLRFSFRGHGTSGGNQRGMTIAGQMLDLQAAVDYLTDRYPGPLTIIASSFGAVSTSLSLPWLEGRLDRLVLWNPVLDLKHTFLNPGTPLGQGELQCGAAESVAQPGIPHDRRRVRSRTRAV